MDREALLSLNGQKSSPDVSVLQNGVDLDYFAPSTAASRQRATIVTSGKMSYHANVTMTLYLAEEIMPRVWAQQPELELVIVGKDPAPEIQSLRHHPRIRVTGTVPDIRPYLSTATVAVAPVTYGAGIQNKVLEAMACGTPVITSAQAVSAIAATPGHHLLVADDATSFAEAILHLTTDKTRREAVGAAGRAYVECHHDWSRIAMALEGIYVRVKQAFAAYA
jgi:glycosyltransferase involved in cell wall biosynthesis